MRTINPAGLALVKRFEGCRLTAYRDVVGVLTIGYGHIKGVEEGDKLTQPEADCLLFADLLDYGTEVSKLVTVPITDNQYAALVSFCYNLGPAALSRSTLLKLVNQSKFAEAANHFPKWNRAGGKILRGLTNRRIAERTLFLTP